MRNAVTVRLTLLEARALSYAAGNTTSAPDIMAAVFTSARERKAAWRAHTKLDHAIQQQGDPHPNAGGYHDMATNGRAQCVQCGTWHFIRPSGTCAKCEKVVTRPTSQSGG